MAFSPGNIATAKLKAAAIAQFPDVTMTQDF